MLLATNYRKRMDFINYSVITVLQQCVVFLHIATPPKKLIQCRYLSGSEPTFILDLKVNIKLEKCDVTFVKPQVRQ